MKYSVEFTTTEREVIIKTLRETIKEVKSSGKNSNRKLNALEDFLDKIVRA